MQRASIFRTTLFTCGGSLSLKHWCLPTRKRFDTPQNNKRLCSSAIVRKPPDWVQKRRHDDDDDDDDDKRLLPVTQNKNRKLPPPLKWILPASALYTRRSDAWGWDRQAVPLHPLQTTSRRVNNPEDGRIKVLRRWSFPYHNDFTQPTQCIRKQKFKRFASAFTYEHSSKRRIKACCP